MIDKRPIAAGILFGMLSYKPHFGILVPVALAADKRWKTFSATTISVVGWITVSLAVFGWKTWHA